MDFLNKLGQKAKKTYQEASQKTGEIAKEAKLRMKMNENKSEINSLYQIIGKKVYESYTALAPLDIKKDLEEECTKIDILSAEIESYLKQIRELKDKKQCPKCFKEIELDAKFCKYCGAEQEQPQNVEVTVVDSREETTESAIELKNEIIDEEQEKEQESNEPENDEKSTDNMN